VVTDLSLYYVYYNFQNQNFINNDSAVPGLNRNQAYSLPFVVPEQSNVDAFDDFVKPIFEEVQLLHKRNDALRETRDMLLPRLVSGALDVSEVAIPEE
jgi:type I restriction enzyme S subunit